MIRVTIKKVESEVIVDVNTKHKELAENKARKMIKEGKLNLKPVVGERYILDVEEV